MGALGKCILREKTENAFAEKETEIIETINDDLLGLLARRKRKRLCGKLTLSSPLFQTPYLAFSLISERYIAKQASTEVMKLNPEKNKQERDLGLLKNRTQTKTNTTHVRSRKQQEIYKKQQEPNKTKVVNKPTGSWQTCSGRQRVVEERQTDPWEDVRRERVKKGTFYCDTRLDFVVGQSYLQ